MTISLLNAVKAAMGESGIELPSAVVANTDKTMLYCANAAARRQRQHEWQKLRKSTTVTLTAATEYNLATDFWAYVPDTLWPEGGIRPAALPTTPLMWTILQSDISINPAQFNCRFLNNKLAVQNPEADIVLRYEYISNAPITDSTGATPKVEFTADTDLFILDEELFIMDLKWRIKKEKGIDDWQFDKQEYENYLNYRIGVDSGARTLYPGGNGLGMPQPPYNNDWVT
jgi:hypothetical protein